MNNIFWTTTAKDSYLATLDFIFDQWSLEVSLEWDKKVTNLLQRLNDHLYLCPPSKKYEGLRRCTITPYTSLVYRIKDERVVELITFFDTRSNNVF